MANITALATLAAVRELLAAHQWTGANEVWACSCGIEGVHGEGDGPNAHIAEALASLMRPPADYEALRATDWREAFTRLWRALPFPLRHSIGGDPDEACELLLSVNGPDDISEDDKRAWVMKYLGPVTTGGVGRDSPSSTEGTPELPRRRDAGSGPNADRRASAVHRAAGARQPQHGLASAGGGNMTYVVRFWGDGAVAGPFADYGAAEAYLLGFPPAVDADIVSLRSPGIARVLFSSATGRWATPRDLYATLDAEFGFDFDPCPLDCPVEFDGLAESWSGRRVFCNPPYGAGVDRWLRKAREATLAVYLLPARTDTAWWHKYAMHADEIRFLRGRLRFGGATASAPFPSVILVYRAGGSGGRPA